VPFEIIGLQWFACNLRRNVGKAEKFGAFNRVFRTGPWGTTLKSVNCQRTCSCERTTHCCTFLWEVNDSVITLKPCFCRYGLSIIQPTIQPSLYPAGSSFNEKVGPCPFSGLTVSLRRSCISQALAHSVEKPVVPGGGNGGVGEILGLAPEHFLLLRPVNIAHVCRLNLPNFFVDEIRRCFISRRLREFFVSFVCLVFKNQNFRVLPIAID
jgi:hypothetical protein